MLIDRTHKPWVFGSTFVLAVSASAYWATGLHAPHGPSGGSVFGLIFGIVGSLLIVFSALLAVRKKLPTWRIGSAQFWLRGHLWLGTLGFVLILFHSGFGWGGLLENLLWISFGLVVLTGFAGVALQQVIPRLLTTRVPLETMVAQIPFLSRTMQFRADQLIAKQTGVLDVEYETLKPFAEEVLKQQRVLKRESDLPKELAKVYANVPLPESDAKKPTTVTPAEIVNTKAAHTSPLPQKKGAPSPAESSGNDVSPSTPTVAPAEVSPDANPKSPLELMRERAAAKAAGIEPAKTADVNPSPPLVTDSEKKLSPIEQMRAKAAAKLATEGSADPKPTPDATVPDVDQKLSPIEQMRAKMAAKSAAKPVAANAAPPVEAVTSTNPGLVAEVTPSVAAKKLSPIEQMQAKLAATKSSSAVMSTETHKPLAVEKPPVAAAYVTDMSAPPSLKKPAPALKPAMDKPAAVAPPKTLAKTAAPVPPALLAELRNFHLRVVRPFLAKGRSKQFRLDDAIAARRVFSQLRSDLPVELHDSLQQLEDFCEERRQFNAQKRFHRWLHWWLILHIPPSIALLVLFVAHVIVTLRVVPFGK